MEEIAEVLLQFAIGNKVWNDKISRSVFAIRPRIVCTPDIGRFFNQHKTPKHTEFNGSHLLEIYTVY